jgi:hypothetical protein
MNRPIVIFVAIVALIVGVIAGGFGVAINLNNSAKHLMAKNYADQIQLLTSKINTEIEELRYLRASQTTNAIESLEFHLEGDLIQLEPFVANPRMFKNEKWNVEVLEKVKDYRAQFPYKTNPDVEKNVAEVFTVLEVQTNN